MMFPTFISVEAPLSISIAAHATTEITIIRKKFDTTATTRALPYFE